MKYSRYELVHYINPKMFKGMDINWEFLLTENIKCVQRIYSHEILKIRKELSSEYVRLIPIQTSTLNMILCLPPKPAWKHFLSNLKKGLKELDYQLTNRLWVKHGFEIDLTNNDVPIFYFHPAQNCIYYQNKQIATMKI